VSTITKKKATTWHGVFDLYLGTQVELAARLGLTKQGLWNLRNRKHVKVPAALVAKLAAALRTTNTGENGPRVRELLVLWHGGAS
jgi:transcriptional regulator with XRE-family HTH domain